MAPTQPHPFHPLGVTFTTLALLSSPPLLADENWIGARPDAHAPIGVMADHAHKNGEWMFGYRYMRSEQSGLIDGTDSVSVQQTYGSIASGGYGYHDAPLEMRMEMHMFELMYALDDTMTLMAMLPYQKMQMSMELHQHGSNPPVRYGMESEGIGDLELSTLLRLTPVAAPEQIHLNLGISLPTGSITEEDAMPHGPGGSFIDMRMEYPMQLGSGTYDLLPGITYFAQHGDCSWGGQGIATLRLGRNSADYSLGDRIDLTGWFAYRFSPSWSGSVRLNGASWGDIDGRDSRLSPTMSPASNPEAQAGERVEAAMGLNYRVPTGNLAGHRFGIELAKPLWERLDGPQLESDWSLVAGWQYAFK